MPLSCFQFPHPLFLGSQGEALGRAWGPALPHTASGPPGNDGDGPSSQAPPPLRGRGSRGPGGLGGSGQEWGVRGHPRSKHSSLEAPHASRLSGHHPATAQRQVQCLLHLITRTQLLAQSPKPRFDMGSSGGHSPVGKTWTEGLGAAAGVPRHSETDWQLPQTLNCGS